MPWVSQSSSTSTSSVRSSTPNTSRGSASEGSATRPCTTRRSHTGAREVKIFVPVRTNPPSSCATARVAESKSIASLPASEIPKAKS